MPAWTNHRAEIYEFGSGDFPGALVGTITNLLDQGAEGTNTLDEAGSGWIKIHGADTPSRSLCLDYRIVRVLADSSVSGSSHEVCCFLIRGGGEPTIENRQVVYKFSGPDLTGLIKFGNINFNVISDNAGGPSATPVADLLASYVEKAWIIVNHGTAPNDAVWVGGGESSFNVLLGLLQQQNAHFSFSLAGNPKFELHVWYEHTEASGTGFDVLSLIEPTDPAASYADPTVAIITKPIRVIKEPQTQFTRGYFYGAGMGVDRWTFEGFSYGGLTIFGWGYNSFTSLIINQELEAQIPIITTSKQFASLEPSDPNDPVAVTTNADAIWHSGLNWLRNHAQSEIVYYEIPDLIVHADLIPGQLVHVTYNRSSPVDAVGAMNPTDIIDLDDDLIVLGIKHRLGNGGVRYTSLLVGETPKPLASGLDQMAGRLKELEETVRHTNAGSGLPGAPGGGGDNGTYLWASGSGPVLSGDLLVNPLVTIDGVDISAHAADPDAHHVPGTLSVSSTNSNTGTERHEIDSSYDPGAQAYLLQTGPAGQVVLVRAYLDSLVLTDRVTAQQYNVFLSNGQMFIEPI